MIRIDASAITAGIASLQRLETITPLLPYLEAGGDILITDARTYPPELPNQRYVRTGDLGDGWRRQVVSSSPTLIALDVFNPVPYGPYVMGADDQTAPFVGRWSTIEALAQDAEDRIAAMLEDGLTVFLEGIV